MRTVDLAAINRMVSLAAYIRAVKTAKANPATEFKTGLTSWWPTSGAEIVQQFRRGMHERISQAIPTTGEACPPARVSSLRRATARFTDGRAVLADRRNGGRLRCRRAIYGVLTHGLRGGGTRSPRQAAPVNHRDIDVAPERPHRRSAGAQMFGRTVKNELEFG